MSADVNRPFSCSKCKEGFTIKAFFDLHMKESHVENGIHGCSECPCVFATAEKLNDHQVKVHDYIQSLPKIVPRKKPKDKQTSLICKHCNITFHTAGFLKTHIQRKHPNAPDSSDDDEDEEDELDEEDEEEEQIKKPGLKYPRFGYDNNNSSSSNNKPNGQQDNDTVKDKTKDIFDRLTNGSKISRDNQEDEEEEEEDVSQSGGDEKSNDSRNTSSYNRRSHRNLNSQSQKTKSYREIDDDDEDEDNSQRKRQKKSRVESGSEDDANVETSSSKTKDTAKSSKHISFSTRNDDDDYDDDYAGPNDNFDSIDHDDDNDYQDESNNSKQQQKRGNTSASSSSFQITTDFSTQNDDDDMEGDDAQRSNIAQLINSIPNDDDDDTGNNNEETTISACEQCGTLYSDPQSLLNHKKTSHVINGQYKCNMCPCVFATGPELIVHNGIFHGSAPTLLPPEKSNDQDKNNLVEIISCEECGEDFSDPLQLTIHKVRNHGAYVPNSDVNGQSSSDTSHTFVTGVATSFTTTSYHQNSTPSYPKRDFFCEICQVDYKTKSNLSNHMKACHVPNGRYPCDVCPCVFNTKNSLNSHNKRHSKEIRSGSMFQNQSAVYNSIGSDNMKIIPCKICDVNFLTMADYLAHKETSHVTNGKYPCSQCLCCFATFETLKTHRVVFHNHSDSAPSNSLVSITTVNTSTASRSSKQQNYYSPSPRKSYSTSQPLVDLANTTSDGKVECPKCGVLLSSRGSLKNHLEKSHVQNGYGCKLCPCKFQGLAGVKSHLHGIHRGILNVGDQYYHPGEVPEDDDENNSSSMMQYDSSSRYSNSSKSYLEDEEFKCAECDWTLSDATDLQNHRIQFHGYKPNFGVRTTFTPTAVDEIINNDDPYSCSACCLTFKRKSETLSHRKRNHVLGGKFRCTLNEHSKTCRIGNCICCKCVYSNAAALKAHEIGKHKALYIKREREKKLQLIKKLDVRKPTPASGQKPSPVTGKPAPKVGPSEFVCNLCGRRYQLFASLGAHKNRSHKTKGVNCSQCTCTFNSQADLDLHFKKYHRHAKVSNQPLQPQKSRGRPKKGGAAAAAAVRFTCQYAQCETVCRSQSALSNHIKTAHQGPVEVVTIDIDDDDRSNTGGSNTARDFPLDYDPIKLSMENPLMTASGKYACRFCNTVFSRSSAMVAHVKTFHMEADKLVCFECTDSDELFSNLAQLTLHRQRVHGHETFDTSLQVRNSSDYESTPIITNCTSLQGVHDSGYEKPAVPRCELCGRVFSHSRSLWTHRKRSHVDGDFNCTESECSSRSCGFGTARGLRNHLLIFHGIRDDSLCSKKDDAGDNEGWLIDCWDCELTFTSNWKLEQHKKRCHVPDGEFPCDQCECAFATSTAMNVHKMKTHGLELPPYVPPVDIDELPLQDDDIEEANYLNNETSSTPGKSSSSSKLDYPCKQCGMIFSLTSALQTHLEQAHVKNGAFPCTECSCRYATSAALATHVIGHNLRNKLNTQEQHSNSSSPPTSTESRRRGRPSSASKAVASTPSPSAPNKAPVAKKKTGGPPPPKTDIVGMALAAAMGSTASLGGASTSAAASKPASSGLACTTCKKAGFPSASVLRRHEVQCKKRTNRPSKTPLECKFCSRKFTLVISLQEHMKLKHSQGGTSDLPKKGHVDMVDLDSDDGGDFHDTSMPSPPRETTPPPPPPPPKKRKTKFPCKECDIIFPKSRILKTHKLICHVKNGALNCDAVKCTCKFNLPWALYFHKKYQHDPNKPIKKRKTKKKKTKKKKKEEVKKNEEKDKEQENDPEAVTLDEKTGERIDPKTGKKIMSDKDKRLLRKIRKGFFSRRTLKYRERLINGIERRHPCGVCAVKFRSPYQLARHERINHPGSPEYLCEKCPSMTALSKELRHHEMIYHSHFLNKRQVFSARKRMKLNNGTAAVPASSSSSTTTNTTAPQSQSATQVIVPTPTSNMNSMPTNPMIPTPIIPSMMQTMSSASSSFIDNMIMKTFNPFKLDENVPLDLSNVIASYSMGGSGVLSGADITAGFSGKHGLMMKNKLLRRKLRRKKGIHMCRMCRMMFFTKRRLSSHLRIHVGEKPFKCRFCAVSFRTYGEYYFHKKKHIAMKAGGKEPVERTPLGRCSYCSATFRTKFLQDCHFDECHPELKFLDMCEQASNLWKEVSKVGPGDNNSVI